MKRTNRRITPEQLQEIFLSIAHKIADHHLETLRKDAEVDYANRPDAFNEDFLALFDEFAISEVIKE